MMALCSLIIKHLGDDLLEDVALHDELSRGARFAFSHVYEKLARKADQNNDEHLKRALISMLDKPGMNSSAIVQISLLLPAETLLKIASDPSAEVFSLIAASKYYPKQAGTTRLPHSPILNISRIQQFHYSISHILWVCTKFFCYLYSKIGLIIAIYWIRWLDHC
jgi:hypothetical protein